MSDTLSQSAAIFVEVGTQLPALAEDCRRVWLETRQDGYPTSSLNGSSPVNVTAEFTEPDGTTVLLTVPQHSDPTGELATNPTTANPARAALQTATSLAKEAERLLEKARAVLLAAVTPPKDDPELEDDPLAWCQVCARAKVMSPTFSVETIHPGGSPTARCSDCTGWAYEALADPSLPKERPKLLIVRKIERGRLTSKDIDEALGRTA